MTEDYLHHIWKHQKIDSAAFVTTSGKSIIVQDKGLLNRNAGPDFLHARVSIDNVEWAGHIEIHIRSSDWYRHAHQNDVAYESVILHVAYEVDKELRHSDGSLIPQMSLKGFLDEMPLWRYEQWLQNRKWIPCAEFVRNWHAEKSRWWIKRMAVERLEQKVERLQLELHQGRRMEQLAWKIWARAFGGPVNADAFEELSRRLDWKLVLRIAKKGQIELDALLFGISGLLPSNAVHEYELQLKEKWLVLADHWKLIQMDSVHWKFSKLRPAGFPTRRIAQLSALLSLSKTDSFSSLKLTSENPPLNEYWLNHYRFGEDWKVSIPIRWGDAFKKSLELNARAIISFALKQQQSTKETNEIEEYESMPAEDNRIVRGFRDLGFKAKDAAETQGLLHLKRNYCDFDACWTCSIGQYLLTSY